MCRAEIDPSWKPKIDEDAQKVIGQNRNEEYLIRKLQLQKEEKLHGDLTDPQKENKHRWTAFVRFVDPKMHQKCNKFI